MGVPLDHPFHVRIFHERNMPSSYWGTTMPMQTSIEFILCHRVIDYTFSDWWNPHISSYRLYIYTICMCIYIHMYIYICILCRLIYIYILFVASSNLFFHWWNITVSPFCLRRRKVSRDYTEATAPMCLSAQGGLVDGHQFERTGLSWFTNDFSWAINGKSMVNQWYIYIYT